MKKEGGPETLTATNLRAGMTISIDLNLALANQLHIAPKEAWKAFFPLLGMIPVTVPRLM